MSLYEGAVKKPIMTSLCFLAVVIFGLFSLSKLPRPHILAQVLRI